MIRPLASRQDLLDEIAASDRALETLIVARPVSVEAAAKRAEGIAGWREYLRRLNEQLERVYGVAA